MKLSFFGAAETVTGSKYLLEESGKKFLIDCGLFQGLKELRLLNWERFPVDPKTIDALLLTHAHLDHTGYIPLLVKQGFKGKIYASGATRDLCEILLLDSGRIQEEDARRANRYEYSKHHPALPLYTEEDAKRCLKNFYVVDFNKEYPLSNSLKVKLTHSGHLLGSAFLTFSNNDTTLVFSGDVGRPNDPVMNPPVTIEQADYLVLESTYGNRLHESVDVLSILEEIINSTVAKGGSVIIPAFAVGRAQSIIYCIDQLKQKKRIAAEIPVYLDSPMAQDATDLWCKYSGEHHLSVTECPRVFSTAKYLQTQEDSKKLNSSKVPAIIISASGMAEGGRVLHHLMHYAPHPENTILFAGFQAGGTRGDRLLKGESEIKIHGQLIQVRARIENIGALSSHADYAELIDWLKGFKSLPRKIFLTHGESDAAEFFKKKLEEAFGVDVVIPHYLESFELSPVKV